MKAVIIKENFHDLPLVEQLAKEAFPPEECLSPTELIRMSRQGQVDFRALYDKSSFVGFMVISLYDNICYLFFLAITPQARSCGYGSQALTLINDLYPGKQQVVDFEMLDDSAPNHEQRISRRAFYLRNGYKETGKYISYLGVDYEILCKTEPFDFESFKRMMERFDIKDFAPVYFER